jgi:hypothetical protein
MKIDISAAPVIGGKVEHDTSAGHRAMGNGGIIQVTSNKLYGPGTDVPIDVLESTTAEVVDDAHARASYHECIYQVRTNEGPSTSNQHSSVFPLIRIHAHRSFGFSMTNCPITSVSIRVRKKQSSASAG